MTSDQLAHWERHRQARASQPSEEAAAARVFPVVGSTGELLDSSEPEPLELELRIGSWAVHVRPLQR